MMNCICDGDFVLCDDGRYLAELLSERQKLGPFVQVLPHCSRLLNQGGFIRSLLLHFVVEMLINYYFFCWH